MYAAAHGADLLAALARRPQQEPAPLIELAVARLLADTDHVLDAQEDDRIARALPRFCAGRGSGWPNLLTDRGLLAPGGDGPPSTVTHREAVLDALAATLAIVTPCLPSPSGRDQV